MKTICLYFQIHQPQRLKSYRFLNIGTDHYYYDDFTNEDIIQYVTKLCYLPANKLMLDMIKNSNKKFKVAFSISGVALDQLEIYAPEVIDGFKQLADTGCVEFLAETYGHSLSSLSDPNEFFDQVNKHNERIEELFGITPKVFRNTELIYSDEISSLISQLGFNGVITEGARHILGWKSPNYVYKAITNPNLKLLLRNERFSEDISTRFSDYSWNEYPLTADKYMSWIANSDAKEDVFNLFMNYEVVGNFNKQSSGIFDFFKALPNYAEMNNISFSTPSEVIEKYKPVDILSVTHPITWVGKEKDVSAWLGNSLQEEAFNKLYSIADRVKMSSSNILLQDWLYLQGSDHFYYMGTKNELPFSPYSTPYEAFSNYMNILSDFMERVEDEFPSSIEDEELNSLVQTINNQAREINRLKAEMSKLQK